MDVDTILLNKDVLIEDGIIKSIKDNFGKRVKSAKHTVIQARGNYLIPGLMDAHVHYASDTKLYKLYDSLYLRYGITTVIALNGCKELLNYRATNRKGPDLYISSPPVNDSTMTNNQALSLLKDYHKAGYDFIKIYTNLSRNAYQTINLNADRFGLRILGHIPSKVGTFEVLSGNQELVSHAEEFLYHAPVNYLMGEIETPLRPDETWLSTIADSTFYYKKYVSPTLITFNNIHQTITNYKALKDSTKLSLQHPIALSWNWSDSPLPKKLNGSLTRQRFGFGMEFQMALVKELYKRGNVLLAGTDAPTQPCLVPGYSLHQEIFLLYKSGLSSYEALKTATGNTAGFLSVKPTKGTIKAGNEASVILLKKNPLVDIQNTQTVKTVFLKGRIVYQEAGQMLN